MNRFSKYSAGADAPVFVTTFIGLACCCILSSEPSFSYIALGMFCIYFMYLVFAKCLTLIKYLYIVFGIALHIFGCALCEFNELYLVELDKMSGFTGSLPLLLLSYWVFLTTLVLFDMHYGLVGHGERRLPIDRVPYDIGKWLTIGVLVVLICMLAHVIASPSFLAGVDRFDYATEHLSGIWSRLDTFMQFLIILPIMMMTSQKKALGYASVFLYLIYLFWTGNKYGAFFFVLTLIIFVNFDKIAALDKKRLAKLTRLLMVAMGALILFAIFAHSFTSSANTSEYLFRRGAQQGQLWSYIYGHYEGGQGFNEFDNEIEAILGEKKSIKDSVGAQHGMYKAMYLAAPASIVDAKLLTGSPYTEAGHALAYYYFGFMGPVAYSAFMAALLGLITNGILSSVENRRYIEVLILVRIYRYYLSSLTAFISMTLFGVASLIGYAYLIIACLARRSNRSPRTLALPESRFKQECSAI